MARIPWVLTDPVTMDSYDLPVNPKESDSPGIKKSLTTHNTTAPGGAVLIFEGEDSPQSITSSGTLLTQGEYEAFLEWADKRYPVELEDDLGRTYLIYIESYEAKRVRSRMYPWRHEFTLHYTILGTV